MCSTSAYDGATGNYIASYRQSVVRHEVRAETRAADDGKEYTREEFMEWFEPSAKQRWENAEPKAFNAFQRG